MAFTLRESYTTGDDTNNGATNLYWYAQTFTATANYDISRVRLYLRRVGSPGNITISIKATSSNLPTGADLCSVTVASSVVDTSLEWQEFDFSSTTSLTSGTVYAVVLRTASGDGSNYIVWRSDNTAASHANGRYTYSANGGVNWGGSDAYDFLFETYSGSAVEYIDGETAIVGSGTISVSAIVVETIDAAVTITGTGSISATATPTVVSYRPIFKTRLVAVGNNRFYYEDI